MVWGHYKVPIGGVGVDGDTCSAAALAHDSRPFARATRAASMFASADAASFSEKGVRLAQKIPVDPCIPAGIQLQKAEVGPTSGPTWWLSHFRAAAVEVRPQARELRLHRLHTAVYV